MKLKELKKQQQKQNKKTKKKSFPPQPATSKVLEENFNFSISAIYQIYKKKEKILIRCYIEE